MFTSTTTKMSKSWKPTTPNKFYGNPSLITVKCSLISPERFQVDLSGFSEDAIAIFKTIPSRSYNPKSRLWSFVIEEYNMLLQKLEQLPQKLLIEKLPNFVFTCLKQPKKEVNIEFEKLDPVLSSSLLPFQVEGLSFGISKNGRCLIADDMGLGKTFQALAIANYYKEEWPLLIVTTASMRSVWEETIAHYLPSISIMNIQYMTSGKDYIGEAKILITSHDLMSRCLDKLKERRFGIIIIDESHVLKSSKSKCYKSALELSKQATRIILLSGTPALSRPSELFTQLSLINNRFFGSFYEYSRRYCDGKTTQFGWDASGKSNLQELEIILAKTFMIRRTKEDVLKALPDKKQEIITLNTNLDKVSVEDRECLIALGKKYSQNKGSNKHAILLTFFSETAKIKVPSVCSYILQILEQNIKFLVFAHHQLMMDAIEEIMHKKNTKFIRIDGSTTSDQRKYFIDKFQYDNTYKCAILSITAANAGITLTAAQLVLFAELHWNPSIISQAESRAHRIGQENQVTVRFLLAPGTADDSIWPLLQEKQRTLNQVGLCKSNFEDLEIKKQNISMVTKGLDLNISSISSNKEDIRTYFTPEKKRKIDDKIVLNDRTVSSDFCDNSVFDDGLDDLFCDIDI